MADTKNEDGVRTFLPLAYYGEKAIARVFGTLN